MISFCDNTGKIFYLPEYTKKPIGYETIENPYIFWIDDEYTNYLSVNNWYIKSIRMLIPIHSVINDINNYSINISIDSNVFKLMSCQVFQDKTSFNDIDITGNFTSNLSNDDIYAITVEDDKYFLIPFYICCNSSDEGTWLSNVLINVNYSNKNYYCPITIGALIKDSEEALIINGRNMGVNLPKDIIKAIYQEHYHNYYNNETLYNEKIKEYLINYMKIKGECGNYDSAIDSLKWFGWGDKIKLYQLLRINNDLLNLYFRNDFDINNDILKTYYDFRNTTLLSLLVDENYEAENTDFNITDGKQFWGEAKPRMSSYFDFLIEVPYKRNINDSFKDLNVIYTRSYFDYTFDELGMKLMMLASYYEKYFLPIHIDLYSTTINHKCYTNDIKLTTVVADQNINSGLYFIGEQTYDKIEVIFPTNNEFMLYQLTLILDKDFNNFTDINLQALEIRADIKRMIEKDYSELSKNTPYICYKLIKEINNYLSGKLDFIDDNQLSGVLNISNILDGDEENYNKIQDLYNGIDILYMKSKSIDIINEKYNEENGYYFIDDVVAEIPIQIKNPEGIKNYYYDCTLILSRNGYQIYESDFKFILNDSKIYNSFIISPRYFNKNYDFTYWYNQNYRIDLRINNWWYSYDFKLLIPKFKIDLGKLEYNYDLDYSLFEVQSKMLVNEISGELYGIYADYIDFDGSGVLSSRIFSEDTSTLSGVLTGVIIAEDANYPSGYILYENDMEYQYNIMNNSDLFTVTNSNFYHEVFKSGFTYNDAVKVADEYWENTYISSDFKYLNVVIYCDIYQGNNRLKYNELNKDWISRLYSIIFSINDNDLENMFVESSLNIFRTDFDTYVMHNDDYWYIVFISKYPICELFEKYLTIDYHNLLNFIKPETYKEISENNGSYYFTNYNDEKTPAASKQNLNIRNIRSNKKFLINRMKYQSVTGDDEKTNHRKSVNQFQTDDVIVAKLISDDNIDMNLMFDMNNSTKWEFLNIDLNPNNVVTTTSNSNIAIISLDKSNIKYKHGYYNISIRYNIDDVVLHQLILKNKFKVS